MTELPKRMSLLLLQVRTLLDQAIAGTHLTRRDLLSVLSDRAKAYKRAQYPAEAQRRSV